MSTAASTTTSITYSLAPMLSVRSGARAVEFYKSAFGAIEAYRMEDLGGAVVARPSAGVVIHSLRRIAAVEFSPVLQCWVGE